MTTKKEEFLERMKNKFDDLNYRWNIERNKLEARAQHESADVVKRFEEKQEALKQYRAQMAERMKDLEKAGGNAWGDVKEGVEDAWKALATAFDKATSQFKK